MNKETIITSEDLENLYKRELKRGDIVTIKEEWLEPDENPSQKYVVLEPRGSDRVQVQALFTVLNMSFAPIFVYDVDWLNYAGHVPEEMK
ncbi:MAG: hypothetical protein Q4A54_14340 [Parabacteroides sp.]|nr:hypothetical protein [Parabacteroides sp.]